jgi:hypothetical protein
VLLDRSQFGPVDRLGLEQSRLEGRGGLTLVLTLVADVRIAPEVAEAKAHQRALLGIVNADVALNELLGLGTRDLDVEVAVAGVLAGPTSAAMVHARKGCARRPPRTGTSRTRWM